MTVGVYSREHRVLEGRTVGLGDPAFPVQQSLALNRHSVHGVGCQMQPTTTLSMLSQPQGTKHLSKPPAAPGTGICLEAEKVT